MVRGPLCPFWRWTCSPAHLVLNSGLWSSRAGPLLPFCMDYFITFLAILGVTPVFVIYLFTEITTFQLFFLFFRVCGSNLWIVSISKLDSDAQGFAVCGSFATYCTGTNVISPSIAVGPVNGSMVLESWTCPSARGTTGSQILDFYYLHFSNVMGNCNPKIGHRVHFD